MRPFFLLIFFSLIIEYCFATHNKGGRIEAKQLSTYEFEVTIYTYTKTSSIQSDRPTLDSVYFGDGTGPIQFTRTSKVDLPNNVSLNTYVKSHTYASNGTFPIHFSDPNWSSDIINFPSSLQTPFYLETIIRINPFLCENSSPHLFAIPIFNFHLITI